VLKLSPHESPTRGRPHGLHERTLQSRLRGPEHNLPEPTDRSVPPEGLAPHPGEVAGFEETIQKAGPLRELLENASDSPPPISPARRASGGLGEQQGLHAQGLGTAMALLDGQLSLKSQPREGSIQVPDLSPAPGLLVSLALRIPEPSRCCVQRGPEHGWPKTPSARADRDRSSLIKIRAQRGAIRAEGGNPLSTEWNP